jgi:hypothetical protein
MSSIVMNFKHASQRQRAAFLTDYYKEGLQESVPNNGQIIPVLLEPGSIICLSGAARYEWTHGIAERQIDIWQGNGIQRKERISITLRKMKLVD